MERAVGGGGGAGRISVVIPTWQEAARIEGCLSSLLAGERPLELLVCDGSSTDATVEIASRFPGVRVLRCPERGRAAQMNIGARAARGEILWFVHADSRVPPGAARAVAEAMADPGVCGGAFRFAVDSPRRVFRLLEWMVRLRCRLLRLPLGDQGIFVRREAFDAAGGVPPVPILEDLYLVRRLRRLGRLRLLPLPLVTSARRWERQGFLATTWTHQRILLLERLGASPQRLARMRRGRGGPA